VRVAVFGGSFNPPHVGHVLVCALVLATEEIDRVLVVPAFQHPFAKPLAPFDDRVAMCELAMHPLRDVEVSRIEEELGGESRTLRTLEHLASAHPDWQLRMIIGADVLAEAPRWFGFDAIERLAPPIVVGRAGVEGSIPGTLRIPDVSSTQVRAAIARGAWDEVAPLVPRRVIEYARGRSLYAATSRS
jgi:nicotinate-nucleotide adenylyltransferase